jgi:hypothetical protein
MVRRFALVLALFPLALPASAIAKEPGVFFDPHNPTRSEYAVPLDAARGEASGSDFNSSAGAGNANSSSPAPLFGVGVSPARQQRTAARTGRTPDRASGQGSAGGKAAAGATPTRLASVGTSRASSSAGLMGMGWLLAVLVVGTAIGLLARRAKARHHIG